MKHERVYVLLLENILTGFKVIVVKVSTFIVNKYDYSD